MVTPDQQFSAPVIRQAVFERIENNFPFRCEYAASERQRYRIDREAS